MLCHFCHAERPSICLLFCALPPLINVRCVLLFVELVCKYHCVLDHICVKISNKVLCRQQRTVEKGAFLRSNLESSFTLDTQHENSQSKLNMNTKNCLRDNRVKKMSQIQTCLWLLRDQKATGWFAAYVFCRRKCLQKVGRCKSEKAVLRTACKIPIIPPHTSNWMCRTTWWHVLLMHAPGLEIIVAFRESQLWHKRVKQKLAQVSCFPGTGNGQLGRNFFMDSDKAEKRREADYYSCHSAVVIILLLGFQHSDEWEHNSSFQSGSRYERSFPHYNEDPRKSKLIRIKEHEISVLRGNVLEFVVGILGRASI